MAEWPFQATAAPSVHGRSLQRLFLPWPGDLASVLAPWACLSLTVNPSVPAQGKGDSIFTSCHPGCLTTMGVISRNWPFFRKRLHLIQAAIKFSSKQKAFQEHLASYKSSTTSTQEKKDFADEPIWVFCIFH